MFKKVPAYPFLFVTYILLSFYAHNIDHGTAVIPIIALLVLLVVTGAIFYLLGKNWHKSALTLFVFEILFFSYGHLHTLISKWFEETYTFTMGVRVSNYVARFDLVLLIILFIVFFTVLFFAIKRIRKSSQDFTMITSFLNMLTAVLMVFVLASLIQGLFFVGGTKRVLGEIKLKKPKIARDIYLIVPDGYGRDDVLKKYFNYDNKDFTNFLKSKGFQYISKGRSNYNWTVLSFPSFMSMEYINYFQEDLGKDSADLRVPFEMIKDNQIARHLRSVGYRYVHFNSTWGATARNRFADMEVGFTGGLFSNEFLRVFAKTTMLKAFDFIFVGDLANSYHYTFDKLAHGANIKGPKFVLVHLMIPHWPYIFDRHGNVLSKLSLFNQYKTSSWEQEDAYIEQLIYVNSQMKKVIETILKESKVKPIIIVQSDHGPQVKKIIKKDPKAFAAARLANYNALLLPEGPTLPNDLTPVNTFRYILNYYFGAHFPILPNKSYFSPYSRPYRFKEQ